LGTLLDRSLAEIAGASRDARTFDRAAVVTAADLWDNATLPLFRAATGGSEAERERRARAALAWMARVRPERRAWMVEQGAAAGHRMEALLPPAPARPDRPYRDRWGTVRPAYSEWTAEALTELSADYALDAATVRHLRVERTGTRLCAFLTVDLVRAYGSDEAEGAAPPAPPALHVRLDDVSRVDADTGAVPGIRLGTAGGGVVIGLGDGGVLRARAGSLRLDDSAWHRSAAGRRADARLPPREEEGGSAAARVPEEGELEGSVRGASTFLLWAMRLIRSVRHPQEVARVPLAAYCRALEGAGRDVPAAGTRPRPEREAAFRALVTGWLRRGGHELAPYWRLLLKDVPDARELAAGVRADLGAEGAVPPDRDTAREVAGLPERSELRMVSYTAGHVRARSPRVADAMVRLAVPGAEEDGPWRSLVLDAVDPLRLRVRTEAFDGAGRVRVDRDGGGTATLVVGDGALSLDARAWSQA
jgi:hypothetical protein